MSTTASSTTGERAERIVVRHPVRGAIWGFLLGLSVAIYLVLFRVVPFGDWLVLGLAVLAGIVVGVVWAYVAPPKQPKDSPAIVHDDHADRVVHDDPASIVDDGSDDDGDAGSDGDSAGGDGGDGGDD